MGPLLGGGVLLQRLYHAILAVPALRRFTFRLLGYRGSLAIPLYPGTWIRDLRLLEVEDGAYLSNKATIGTNMCTQDGTVIVAPVRIGKGALVGHLAMLAPGVVLGERAEVGVGCAIGLRARIGARTRIAPCTTVNHGATLGSDFDIGCAEALRSLRWRRTTQMVMLSSAHVSAPVMQLAHP